MTGQSPLGTFTSATLTLIGLLSLAYAGQGFAQGQDTTPWSRDLQVIEVMLPGFYSNAQPRHNLLIEAAGDGFDITLSAPDGTVMSNQRWSLAEDDQRRAVRMDISDADGTPLCPVWWTRDAAQFSATSDTECAEGMDSPDALALGEQQFWWTPRGDSRAAVKLHRARQFTCYADIPGVGGGRDIPYARYDNLSLHDQGAETWFVDKDGRNLGLRLFNVDWPINNYDGYFTRDSLVIYVVEKLDDGSTKEHGYAFTLPEANRIGINLKWLLASCFMISGKVDTPTM
jgi:hypothetical protein